MHNINIVKQNIFSDVGLILKHTKLRAIIEIHYAFCFSFLCNISENYLSFFSRSEILAANVYYINNNRKSE